MFSRPVATYEVQPTVLDSIMADAANALLATALRIPPGSTVLDIGAGSGLLPQVLHRLNVAAEIDGIDPSPDAAAAANANYRAFYCQDAGRFMQEHTLAAYDVVTLNDVIEHMPDPLAFLTEVATHLPQHARIVLTTPNIAYAGMRAALWRGHFDYVDSGILERTHLRFFSEATLVDLFRQAGLAIEQEVLLQRRLGETEFADVRINFLEFLSLRARPLGYAYQFLFVLMPSSSGPPVPLPATDRLGEFTSVPRYMAGRARRMARALQTGMRRRFRPNRAATA